MDTHRVSVYLYKGDQHFDVLLTETLTGEDVCIAVAKFLKFRPVSFHLFGIRLPKSDIWLPGCHKFSAEENYNIEFRLRFKLPVITELSRLDENAFDYCFHQTRHDLLLGEIADVSQDAAKNVVLGLCVTDMLRVIQEEDLPVEVVANNYKQFIPKSIYKKHHYHLFLKKKIHDSLATLLRPGSKRDVKFIKEQYLSQVEDLAPRYLVQEFHALTYKENEYPATIRIDPYHCELPGVSISYIGKQNWEHICSIEELCFISMRADCTAEIARKNGIPVYFKFKTLQAVHSFVSHLDGYYRLCEKSTFNLCIDLPTPSLMKLKINKCHGPVGEKFAHQKLSMHPNTASGTYILRQSSTTFDEYCIDFVLYNKNRPISYSVQVTPNGKFQLERHVLEFNTVAELISHFISSPQTDFLMKECLPPSEYDRSPLLLCRKHDENSWETLFHRSSKLENSAVPQCIPARNLKIFCGKKYEYEGRTCKVSKAIWKPNKTTTADVAIKYLKKENQERLMKEFLEMADHCVLWQCESLVGLRGMILGNPQAMVLEWMPYGPLDAYLKEHPLFLENLELVQAASQIARALWFLEDHGIVHGNIRCHNVLVYEHTDSAFVVKLADPSIPEYMLNDIHWIPPEIYDNPCHAKSLVSADVWALGTTLWQVFSCGQKPADDIALLAYKTNYLSGWRLPRPAKCPPEVYRIISECWSQVADCRKQPQAIVRDIHQILYQMNGSKRAHSYATVTTASSEGSQSQTNGGGFDLSSDCNWTTFGSEEGHANSTSDGTVSTFVRDSSIHSSESAARSLGTQFTWLFNGTNGSNTPDLISGFSTVYNHGSIGTIYSTGSAQGIYMFEKEQFSLGRMIGQGCYGAVFMGQIKRSDGSEEAVAVKMMKESIAEKEEMEFQRECEILKSLNHPNIVKVKGFVCDPTLMLVMEYLPMGSLLDYFRFERTKPSFRQLMKFAEDICEGMEYLVSHSIVHRDLAARNILVENFDLVKISDFGLARITDNDNCYNLKTHRRLPVKWYPPESLQGFKFSEQSDVWSYGVTLYEIFTYGKEPNLPGVQTNENEEASAQVELDEMISLLNQGVRLPCPELCPQIVYVKLMLQCWQDNAQERPSFSKLLGEIRDVKISLLLG